MNPHSNIKIPAILLMLAFAASPGVQTNDPVEKC